MICDNIGYINNPTQHTPFHQMFKQVYVLLALLLAQLISAGPAPEQPINGENPEFGRGRGGGGRDRWTWCRCVIDRRWEDDGRDGRGGRRDL